MNKQYIKSIEDEIDWKVIDQLHGATVTFSSTSLELKKLFFVLVGIAIPSLIKLAGDKLDLSLFVSIYFLTITFWLLDSFTYFYQEKLREKMNDKFIEIRLRNKESIIQVETTPTSANNEITLEKKRTAKTRLKRSLFNNSMLLYLLMFILITLSFTLFKLKIIG